MSSRPIEISGLLSQTRGLELRFPDEDGLAQDREWVEALVDGEWHRYRLHDYDELYRVPGLYETIFQRTLETNSPARVVSLLQDVLTEYEGSTRDLRMIDVGAGNGMVAYELQNIGVTHILGVDIIEDAKLAALRDRPWCYDGYFVIDLTDVPGETEAKIREYQPNSLACVAALGFNDIPAAAFLKAVDLIDSPGWLAFNIKEDFVQERDNSGFAMLLKELAREDVVQMVAYRRYRHRLAIDGTPLHYIAIVARKMRDVPEATRRAFAPANQNGHA